MEFKQPKCSICGKFMKRGLWNWMDHELNCPERRVMVWGGEKSWVVRAKELER